MYIYIYIIFFSDRYWGHMMFPSISKSCQVQVFNTMEGRPLVPYQAVVRSSQWLAVKTRFEAAWKVHKVWGGKTFPVKKTKQTGHSKKLGLKFIISFWWWGTLQLGVVILLDPEKKYLQAVFQWCKVKVIRNSRTEHVGIPGGDCWGLGGEAKLCSRAKPLQLVKFVGSAWSNTRTHRCIVFVHTALLK